MKAIKVEFASGGFVATPVITVEGNNTSSVKVSATCATASANIKYSVNGGSTWTNYTHSITYTAAGTKTIIMKAEKSGMFHSKQASETFTVTEEQAEQ